MTAASLKEVTIWVLDVLTQDGGQVSTKDILEACADLEDAALPRDADDSALDSRKARFEALRRRIYEVLHVLVGAGLVSRHVDPHGKRERASNYPIVRYARSRSRLPLDLPFDTFEGISKPSPAFVHVVPDDKDRCPTAAALEEKRSAVFDRVEAKRAKLAELVSEEVALRALIRLNAAPDRASVAQEQRISMPFVVVNTNTHTLVECDMDARRRNVLLAFDGPFDIKDDVEVLGRMRLAEHATREDVDAVASDEVKDLLF